MYLSRVECLNDKISRCYLVSQVWGVMLIDWGSVWGVVRRCERGDGCKCGDGCVRRLSGCVGGVEGVSVGVECMRSVGGVAPGWDSG